MVDFVGTTPLMLIPFDSPSLLAALPLDVRKGFAFPLAIVSIQRGYALRSRQRLSRIQDQRCRKGGAFSVNQAAEPHSFRLSESDKPFRWFLQDEWLRAWPSLTVGLLTHTALLFSRGSGHYRLYG